MFELRSWQGVFKVRFHYVRCQVLHYRTTYCLILVCGHVALSRAGLEIFLEFSPLNEGVKLFLESTICCSDFPNLVTIVFLHTTWVPGQRSMALKHSQKKHKTSVLWMSRNDTDVIKPKIISNPISQVRLRPGHTWNNLGVFSP